jgi:methanogenic corrinoid protein MtbC1
MHDLGKSIVIAMLSSAGYQVHDLGVDVPADTFIEKTKELKPDILGLGAYMSTTMEYMRDIINRLADEGIREEVKVLIGGVPTSDEFSAEIKADAWGKDALDAVEKANQLLG